MKKLFIVASGLLLGANLTASSELSKASNFMIAVKSGDLDKVKAFLTGGSEDAALVNYQDSSGSPLSAAIGQGKRDLIDLLIQHGANINLAHNPAQLTPLMVAIAAGKPADFINFLISRGANVQIKSKLGLSALEMMIMKKLRHDTTGKGL